MHDGTDILHINIFGFRKRCRLSTNPSLLDLVLPSLRGLRPFISVSISSISNLFASFFLPPCHGETVTGVCPPSAPCHGPGKDQHAMEDGLGGRSWPLPMSHQDVALRQRCARLLQAVQRIEAWQSNQVGWRSCKSSRNNAEVQVLL